jgi:prolyl oligopeptidase
MVRRGWFIVMALSLVATTVACRQSSMPPVKYPATTTGDVVDEYFGAKVADPYRWMEDGESKEVAGWVESQNAVTFAYLEKLPMRERFQKRITELWDYPRVAIPVRDARGRYFYTRNTGLQRQSPLYMRDGLAAPPTLVIDPNRLWPDASISLTNNWAPSHEGRLLAYAISEGGADWQTVRVRDVDGGKDLPDELRWVRFSSLSWTRDDKGFFYSRFPEPPAGKVLEAALANQALYYHRLGTPQAQDRLIYARKDLPAWFVYGGTSEDGRYLFVMLSKGSDNNNRLYYADLRDPKRPDLDAPIRALFEEDDAELSPIGNEGPVVYLRSDRGAPNRKVVSLDLTHPEPSNWKTVVPEAKEAIETARFIGGRVVVQYLVDVQSRLAVFGADGSRQGDVPLPGTGTVSDLAGRGDVPEIWYSFTSPLQPATVFVHDPRSGQASPFEPAKPPVDTAAYETRALFATSKDGTRVPLFLSWRKGMALDGSHPTMLYGYGGFSVSMLPTYRSDVPAWLEAGGIWVTANMRGGAEYGESWHKAGYLKNKQRVFDDFIAVAEYLVKEKYTSPGKLGIMGGSNGGLLVGAVEQQRPDLFAVALPAVGVMDMLRYHKFTGGNAWATEYGTSDKPGEFAALVRYSPLHNAKPGTCYPPTLVITADHDDRVVPSHSFKFTAAMQAAQGCANPILIRVETKGSHGYRPTDKRIAELADQWAFAAAAMGMK